MGLPSGYGIIANRNEMIDIESTPGAGTMVNIYLPEAQTDQTDQPGATSSGQALRLRYLFG